MRINAVNTLEHQRLALEAENSLDVYQNTVMPPIKPFWETMLQWQQKENDENAALNSARMMKFFVPEDGKAQGLAALKVLQEANTFNNCKQSLEHAIKALEPTKHGAKIEEINFSVALTPENTHLMSEDYGGWGAMPGMVMVLVYPNEKNIKKLVAATAHEFNHNVRFSIDLIL